ncbi:MAG: 2-C-methyl-D-erythritol 4-phosphate cytidylyltransferase [Clostridia bacterium]|nr:2-C-methyl-D-erythritol 4-phosphate cytidylyltransferase [Clostridia bacterium]
MDIGVYMTAVRGKNKYNKPFCSAVIVAAGSSERMGSDKLFMTIAGIPVIVRTIGALQESPYIDEIVVVTRGEKIPAIADLCRMHDFLKVKHLVAGADNRTGSALAGVRLCSSEAGLIAIHDGARPLVTGEVIARAVMAAAEHGAAAPAVKVKETVRQALAGVVTKTLDRETMYLMQTPQVFRAEMIRSALGDASRLGLSLADDCEAVMLMDAQVHLVDGSDENIKLTTPSDIYVAEAIIRSREGWS